MVNKLLKTVKKELKEWSWVDFFKIWLIIVVVKIMYFFVTYLYNLIW